MIYIKRILIIRFRQIGDSILTLPLCSTLKRSFPEAEIQLVLNQGIAPLFEGHPDIDKVITFNKHELSSFPAYVKRVRQIVRQEKYDVIIDMRSTIRTLLFSLLSLRTPFRIGRVKAYSRLLINYPVDTYSDKLSTDMVQRNLLLTDPLNTISPIQQTKEFKLSVTEEENRLYCEYLEKMGIRFDRPILLVGVTTKIAHKKWDTAHMKEVLRRLLSEQKDMQLIFNYAPGEEESDARNIYKELGSPENIKIDVQATSLRQLVALTQNCTFYFGNEGGARHIAQACSIPSYAIFSPNSHKSTWLPQNSVPAYGIGVDDVLTKEQKEILTYSEQFTAISPDVVYEQLKTYLISSL